jgi:DNA-binding CsgD family transcriptional regulator
MSTVVETGGRVLDFTAYADARAARQETGDYPVRALLLAFDQLEQCFAIYDRMGRVSYTSRTFVAELEAANDAELVRAQIVQFAQSLAAIAAMARLASTVQRLEGRTVTSARGQYQLQGTYIGHDLFGSGPSVLVSMVPPPADLCSTEQLGVRFPLTRAQARVARLLAHGLRNGEIAERLYLSEHTVRHHIEQIRSKVGGHTRSAMAARLRGQA